MAELLIQIETDPNVDLTAVIPQLDGRLSELGGVEVAESVVRDSYRIGVAEIIAGVTTAVVLAGGASQLTAHLRDILRNIKECLQELKGLKDAYIELRGDRIPLEGATDAQLEALVASVD
jgi:hypothetical protein